MPNLLAAGPGLSMPGSTAWRGGPSETAVQSSERCPPTPSFLSSEAAGGFIEDGIVRGLFFFGLKAKYSKNICF